jgi:methyl-accepting chemotaxis protein
MPYGPNWFDEAEVALGLIVLYGLITLLFATLLFIAGRLQARSKTAIDRLTVIVERLTEYTSTTAQSTGSPAISNEFRTAVDRLTAELKQLRERSTDAERGLSSAEAGDACNAAIELLMAKIDHRMHDQIGMTQQVAKELKAAIDALNSRMENIAAIVHPAEVSSHETTLRPSVTFDTKTLQDLRDLLKAFE